MISALEFVRKEKKRLKDSIKALKMKIQAEEEELKLLDQELKKII